MCSRYSIVASAEEIASRFSVDVPPYYKPNYNASPSQLLPVITMGSKGISTFYWGIAPGLAKNKVVTERIINFRSEQIAEKAVYKKAIQSRRCLVPADGYYEWKKIGKKSSTPYRIIRKDRSLFSFAGVWEEYEDVSGESYHTFSIFTTAANNLIATVHDRMPVILNPETEKIWCSANTNEREAINILNTLPSDQLDLYTISSRINSVENNDKSLILPAPAQDQYGNLTLFS